MFRKSLEIARLYLRTTYASRATLIFSLLMPMIFTAVLGLAMQGVSSDSPESYTVWIVDEDDSELSARLIEKLRANPLLDIVESDESAARAAVEEEEILAALILPKGFETRALQSDSVELTFLQNAASLMRAQIPLEAVRASLAEFSGSLAAADISLRVAQRVLPIEEDAAQSYKQRAFEEAESAWETDAPLTLHAEEVTRLKTNMNTVPTGGQQSSPGMLVMFALFFTFGGGATLLVEREEGTLRRLLTMPLSKTAVLSGKLLGIFLGALLQMLVMILFGAFALNLEWGTSPSALAAMLLSYAFASASLGLMLAALVQTAAQANAAGTIVVMILSSLGGAWWPLEIVPSWMQSLALFLPTGWAMRGFQDILVRGLGLNAVLPEAAILTGFGILFLAIGAWRFRYE